MVHRDARRSSRFQLMLRRAGVGRDWRGAVATDARCHGHRVFNRRMIRAIGAAGRCSTACCNRRGIYNLGQGRRLGSDSNLLGTFLGLAMVLHDAVEAIEQSVHVQAAFTNNGFHIVSVMVVAVSVR